MSTKRSFGTVAPRTFGGLPDPGRAGRRSRGRCPRCPRTAPRSPATARPSPAPARCAARRAAGCSASSVNAANAPPTAAPISRDAAKRAPVVGAHAAGGLPAGEGAEREERSVGEVQHAHQAVDQGQPGGDEEVERAEAEPGDEEQDDGAHARCPRSVAAADGVGAAEVEPPRPGSRRGAPVVVGADAEQAPDQCRRRRAARSRTRRCGPRARRTAPRRRRRAGAPRRGSARPAGSARSWRPRRAPRRPPARSRGARPLVGSSTSSTRLSVQQRAGERDHLLLPAGERPGGLAGALDEVGEERVDELPARAAVPLGEPQVLGHGELGEDLAVLGDVADAAAHDPVRGLARRSARRPARPSRRCGSIRPRTALMVLVLPTPLRPSSAVTPVSGTEKDTSSTTCCPPMRSGEPGQGQDVAHGQTASPR